MVVLDALHWIQGHEAPDLAVRWNCKAAKCGSCSAEVDGRPSLTCKTRLSDFDLDQPITVEPMRAFPHIRDLVTDVSWNYEVNKTIQPFTPPTDVPQEDWRWQQEDIERVQEYRKCIECFLCQDVCHVLRNHETERPFMGPRYLVRTAGLEMHPIDQADRREYLKESGGIGYCNITKCCTEVCPEHIKITDNAIIPLKERVADKYYDPIQWVWRKVRGGGSGSGQGRDGAARPPGDAGGVADGRRPRPGARLSDTLFPDLESEPPRPLPRRHARGVHRPHRRRGARQSGTGVARGGAVRPGPAGRPRRSGGPGRVDLGLPRRPDQQRRRVHRASSGRSSWPASSGRARSISCSTRSSSSSSCPVAGGSRTPSSSRCGRRRAGPCRASSAGRRRTCRAPATRSPTPSPTRRSTVPRRAVRRRSSGGRVADAGHPEPRPGRRRLAGMSTRLLPILLLAVVLAGCAGAASSPSASVSPVDPAAPAGIEGSWKAVTVAGQPVVPGHEPTATFSATEVNGTTGCNSYGGGVHLRRRRDHVRPVADDADGLHRARSARSRDGSPRP